MSNIKKYKKVFEDAIARKLHNVSIEGVYKTKERSLIMDVINELIQRKDIQNIHHIRNNDYIIEYEN